MNDTKRYVAGLIFDLSKYRILLIKKNKPVWQAGYYNGIGGKIELGETPLEAIIREVKEEVNLNIKTWTNFAELKGIEPPRLPIENNPIAGNEWSVEWFYTFTNKIMSFENLTEEKAEIFQVKLLPKVITNINWLIPMALTFEKDRADKLIITEIIGQ